jgi:hypothetical protein
LRTETVDVVLVLLNAEPEIYEMRGLGVGLRFGFSWLRHKVGVRLRGSSASLLIPPFFRSQEAAKGGFAQLHRPGPHGVTGHN